jgi:hypothetical protein
MGLCQRLAEEALGRLRVLPNEKTEVDRLTKAVNGAVLITQMQIIFLSAIISLSRLAGTSAG